MRAESCRFGGFALDLTGGKLSKNGASVPLPPKAVLVLALLVERAGRYLTADEILDRLSPGCDLGEANVTQYVAILRKALGDDARNPSFIQTKYGAGFRFVAAVQRESSAGSLSTNLPLLKARLHLDRRRPQDLKIALAEFARICSREPENVAALLGVAETSSTLGSHLLEPPATAFSRASRFARRAERLAPGVARVHGVLAHIALFCDHDLEGAVARCERAMRADDADTMAIRVLGRVAMLRRDWNEARRFLLRELELRPDSMDALTMLGVLENYRGNPACAAELLAGICELDGSYAPARYYLSGALVEAGYASDAIAASLPLCRRDATPCDVTALGRAYAAAGKNAPARLAFDALARRDGHEYVSPYLFSTLHVALGETGRARERMREAIERHDPWAVFFPIEPRFDPIRL